MLELAFPDDGHAPAEAAEMLAVVRDVPRELVRPEFPVAFWGGGVLAALVPVPEAAMDEDHGAVLGQYDVGFAGEIRNMEPKAVAR